MNIIVVGCNQVGAGLAYRLFQKGHEVTVVDRNAAAFDLLPPDFRGRTVEGEALSQNVLHRAGIEQAEAIAVVTDSDSLNAVVAHVARATYRVPAVVVRNYNPRRRFLYEAFGLAVVSPAGQDVQQLEELLCGPSPRTLFPAGQGEVELYEVEVPAAWHGRTLGELLPSGHCLPVVLTRDGRASLPMPGTLLEAGDLLHVSATAEGIAILRQRLTTAEREK